MNKKLLKKLITNETKKHISSAITFLLCVFLFSSCEEKEKVWTELPPATQTGANTIGCLVDGQLWATGKIKSNYFSPSMIANYTIYPDSAKLYININGRNGAISFFMNNPKIGNNTATHIKAKFSFKSDCEIFEKDTIGVIKITKLETNPSPNYTSTSGIISGTFSCQLPCENNPTDIINITD